MTTFLTLQGKRIQLVHDDIIETLENNDTYAIGAGRKFLDDLALCVDMPTDTLDYNSINFLKDAVLSFRECFPYGEYSTLVEDIFFSIETQYQAFYGLDENNWDLAEEA